MALNVTTAVLIITGISPKTTRAKSVSLYSVLELTPVAGSCNRLLSSVARAREKDVLYT